MKSLRILALGLAVAITLLATIADPGQKGAHGAEVTQSADCLIAWQLATRSQDVITPSGNETVVCHLHRGGNASGGGGAATIEEVSCSTIASGSVTGTWVSTPSGNDSLHCHYPQGRE